MAGNRGCALVVGASTGIGRALVLELARKGYRVAAVARRAAELESLRAAADQAAGGAVVFVYPHDVVDYAATPELFDRIVADLGGLDTVVYAAGVLPKIERDEYSFAKDRAILEVNLLGAVAWLDCAAVKFAKQRSGTICGISSIAGDRGRRAFPAYHAAKAGLSTFLEALRNRLAPFNVSVVTIKPGFVDTAMTKGLKGLFWVISAETAAATIVRHVEARAHTKYVPARWGLVSLVIRSIPSFIFRRLDL